MFLLPEDMSPFVLDSYHDKPAFNLSLTVIVGKTEDLCELKRDDAQKEDSLEEKHLP